MNRIFVSAVVALGLLSSAANASTVLITGTNRGIGLEFVKQYAEKGWDVIATARNPEKADELQALAKAHKKVKVEKLDVTDVAQIEALAAKYKGKPVDVLINNAGTLGDVPKQTIGALDQAEFVNVLNANAFGALKLTEAFKANLAAGQMKKAFGMTSGLGSSELTARRGGFYAYRMSKAAVNIGFRALAADWKAEGIMVGVIAPGMVETDLLRASNFPGKGISTQESVTGMMKVIDGMTFENNQKPTNYNGETIPW
ncbi:MAG: SDR family oxidoreductase [Rhodospirillaceae bacterium]|nr:SDR family oxidoreductase [Rhodospirillaceae bacterium]